MMRNNPGARVFYWRGPDILPVYKFIPSRQIQNCIKQLQRYFFSVTQKFEKMVKKNFFALLANHLQINVLFNWRFFRIFWRKIHSKVWKIVKKIFLHSVRITLEMNVWLGPHLHKANSFSGVPRLPCEILDPAFCFNRDFSEYFFLNPLKSLKK